MFQVYFQRFEKSVKHPSDAPGMVYEELLALIRANPTWLYVVHGGTSDFSSSRRGAPDLKTAPADLKPSGERGS